MKPKLSVCIPTYNGVKYIGEQIETILLQLSPFDEIIISDDHSTDETVRLIAGLNDKRIKIFIHDKINNPYKGTYGIIYQVYKNVENALLHAQGEYIFLADQDDIWLPQKVDKVMQAFAEGAACILHNNKVVDGNHNILLESYFSLNEPSLHIEKLIFKCFFQGACMAFTKQVLEYALPFPANSISHDHWIAYNACFRNLPVIFIQEPLLLYRRHGKNVSPSAEKSPNSLWFKLSYRFRLLYAFISIKLSDKK